MTRMGRAGRSTRLTCDSVTKDVAAGTGNCSILGAGGLIRGGLVEESEVPWTSAVREIPVEPAESVLVAYSVECWKRGELRNECDSPSRKTGVTIFRMMITSVRGGA